MISTLAGDVSEGAAGNVTMSIAPCMHMIRPSAFSFGPALQVLPAVQEPGRPPPSAEQELQRSHTSALSAAEAAATLGAVAVVHMAV